MVLLPAVIKDDFNKYVNMTANELESFLKTDESRQASWPFNDGSAESVDEHLGQRIVDILRENPTRNPNNYATKDFGAMRKAVVYCKRLLADGGRRRKSKKSEELKAKSMISLKNWGHDPLKAAQASSGSKAENSASRKEDAAGSKHKESKAEGGEKRRAPAEANDSETQPSKRAKRERKPPSEGTRKTPS